MRDLLEVDSIGSISSKACSLALVTSRSSLNCKASILAFSLTLSISTSCFSLKDLAQAIKPALSTAIFMRTVCVDEAFEPFDTLDMLSVTSISDCESIGGSSR